MVTSLSRYYPVHRRLCVLLEKPILYHSKRWMCNVEDESATSFYVQDYEDFQERVLESDVPVVVDFYADWCGPCKLLGPRLESIVDGREGRVLLAKVNVDDNAEIAMDYEVNSVPTILGVKDGQIVDQMVGLQENECINGFLDKLLVE